MINWDAVEKIPTAEDAIGEGEVQRALQYLRETDWYLIRKLETLEEVPENVTVNRDKARRTIKEYKNAAQ